MKSSLKILNSKEIKKIKKLLKEQFGFDNDLNFVFLMNEKNKIYIINKDISKINLDNIRINTIGLYFAQLKYSKLRLSIDGAQLIGNNCKKNIIEIDDVQLKQWLKGDNIEINDKLENSDFVILKYNNDFVGCGKYADGKILNFVSKARRLNV